MHDEVKPDLLMRAGGYYRLGCRADGSVHEGEPAAVLFSFACELVLKGLAQEWWGHDLSDGFAHLSAPRQKWLEERYRENESADLVTDLKRCSNIFVQIRYWHEKGGGVFDVGRTRKLARFFTDAGHAAIAERPGKVFHSSAIDTDALR